MSENLSVTKDHQSDNSDQQESGINDRNRCVAVPWEEKERERDKGREKEIHATNEGQVQMAIREGYFY